MLQAIAFEIVVGTSQAKTCLQPQHFWSFSYMWHITNRCVSLVWQIFQVHGKKDFSVVTHIMHIERKVSSFLTKIYVHEHFHVICEKKRLK